jgi:PST family polysaccharide transporter
LIALATFQSFSFLITLFLCYKKKWFKFSYFVGEIDKGVALNLCKYTAMAVTSAICIPVSHMFVRNHLGESFGWELAGYWEAMWRLSATYLLFITSTLSVYYLPKLAGLKKPREIFSEVMQGYKIILPLTAVMSITIYFLRDFIIPVLFSDEFLPMRDLFLWQLLGDTLKVGSWILAYLMLGKTLVKLYVITEILSSAGFVILTVLFTDIVGFEGVSLAYSVNYLLYWAAMIYFVFYKHVMSDIK